MIQERESFVLKGERIKEVIQVLDKLEQQPIVFVWAPAGNGKTSFGREFQRLSPIKSVFTFPKNVSLENASVDDSFFESEITEGAKVIVFDEFSCSFQKPDLVVDSINQEISRGRKFVFLVHKPKSSYLDFRRYHLKRMSHIIDLVRYYPDAPWIYLRKWKPTKHIHAHP